ncbi:pyruvate kinase [Leptomonas pyrrhocoris]|uniref:Pyruvate kinase n=1 Tax=Leptomonas pyrrhocoris TaxID=157538 RepID=A0A0M9GA35_LEPPY|nr:pyruvate kinase [Leptomonas pyrrhocoris]XP_015664278.1 pyruvate kinase [Leptomonas pyrrhocoris]XP_015664279.1 pyruvate kinase [Leptomonas pyrrhocoris]XP_015664280.1 pyruvate kinase [Leptomonas pyrrhocoris]XP_015664281.1 pyruvate kinase [Leptomonas pyrrhocoris]KPA85838.1 pyruvate kinase [Leptomonas pyrrhocoris]KPA85839.1 pyruvate kinase [Leptomonas pyrrhocoris]KPA85840.1 pyruvate kinase [Leptomonas pyrrhocoris]KPA85841.1 pyruvate kinase [Leptomonas pyrrhocoris]KPA85842.1 pyruvate kinase |eukprot:XP_015664277.1 pyruvate kinase [Leptomonas pyrrhocoris]
MSQLAHNLTLSIFEPLANYRANRIICTIGPSTQSVEALKALIQSGMSVARMNFSHGSHEYHQTTINNVRQAAAELGVHVAIALDTKGPEIRTGLFVGGEAVMEQGAVCYVTTDPAFADKGTKDKFYIDYPNLPKVVRPGGYIYIDDGILILHVLSHEDDLTLKCTVANAHTIADRRGVNLPGCNVDLPAVSEKDRGDLQFGVEQGVDMIFASFIRSADQVEEVRKALGPNGRDIMIICKIENHQGVQDIDAIIHQSDGIMVARGDLGVEIPAEKVVVAQKILISKCNVAGKPVICATQMLESMTFNPRPTRAEVSDVANAVFNGADCVMLSGETAKGKYPNEVVQYMARICLEAQSAMNEYVFFNSIKKLQTIPMSAEEAVCSSAVNSVYETKAKVMVVLSNTGRSARLVAKYRPNCPIVCVTTRLQTCRQLNVTQSVESVFFDADKLGHDEGKEDRVSLGVAYAKSKGYVQPGDFCVAIHADHRVKGYANQTRILLVD